MAALAIAALAQHAFADGGVCDADLDGCGSVDTPDLLLLLQAWGPNRGHQADMNGDGVVGGWDLGYLLGHWGACTANLPAPQAAALELAVVEITDAETLSLGLREFDVFAPFASPDDELLNVFDADASCSVSPCIAQAPVGGALPLQEQIWKLLGLTYDSFVTVGLEFADGNGANLDLNFDTQAFIDGDAIAAAAGWFAAPTGQGIAGRYPNNEVRIATLTLADGTVLSGQLSIMYRDGTGRLFLATPSLAVGAAPCPWDCGDGDGVVGIVDMLALLSQWGTPGSCEFNGDGAVGIVHLLELIAHWGACP